MSQQPTFYEQVGGHETFARLVHRFYEGVATDAPLRALYPDDDLAAAEHRWLRHMRDAVDSLALPPADELVLWDYLERAAHSLVNTPG